MDDGSRRRRRTTTQPQDLPRSSPQPGRGGNMNVALDDTPYLSPSGRPMRQRSLANLRAVSPPAAPSSRPLRASSSRAAKQNGSSTGLASFHGDGEGDGEESEEEYEEEEEEVMPSRSSRRSSGRAKQQQQQPQQPPAPAPAPAPLQQPPSSSPFKVTLGGRHRGAPRGAKRARLAEEQNAGWMAELDNEGEAQVVYSTIIAKLQSWLSSNAVSRLSDFLESTPAGTKFEKPMTLGMISEKVARSEYGSSIDFEKDMLQLFYNGRRYFETGSEEYRGVATVQRMYNHMTQSPETAKEDIEDEVIARNFASLRYGPCEDQGEGQGEAGGGGEKVVVPYVRYKGQAIQVGNFVHLSNPTDPSRPIIAQVFKTRTEDLNGGKQDWITACWFLRPEQTKHPRSMLFWPGEALKTSQFVEHHVEDVLEMVCVMYYTKYMKGRPAEGEGGWREGDPLYVCENRFHAEKEQFYKIKNWSGVMPEEVRNKRFDMVEFDQPMLPPPKVKSPFLLGSNGPGGIAEEGYRSHLAAPTLIRSNSSFLGSGSGVASPQGGEAGGLGSMPRAASRFHASSTTAAPTSTTTANTTTSSTSTIPQLFKEWSEEVQTQRKAFLAAKQARAEAGPSASEADFNKINGTSAGMEQMPPIAQAVDRSVSNALIQMDVPAYYKTLPNSTQQLFHQDAESGTLLWYPAPPSLAPSEVKTQREWNQGNRLLAPSLDYLYHLATQGAGSKKRKAPPTTRPLDGPTRRHQPLSLPLDEGRGVDASQAFSAALQRSAQRLAQYMELDDDEPGV